MDTDQSGDSGTVITSALKMIANAVNLAIESHYDGNFPGGQSVHMSANLNADLNGVGLEMSNAKFRNFTKEEYEKIHGMIAGNQDGISSSIITDINIKATDIPCEYVIVEE